MGNNENLINKLLENLDEEQKAAVSSELKDTLVLANAGSGKTRTLTHRVAYYILNDLSGIMLLTFTNKASREMLERVGQLITYDEKKVKLLGGTFHSIAIKFLKKYSSLLGFDSNFGLLTPDDAVFLIKKITSQNKTLENTSENFQKKFPKSKEIFNIYSTSFNKHISIKDYMKNKYSEEVINIVKEILIEYKKEKIRMGLMDFDDLLLFFYLLLKNKPSIRKKINNEYPYILVDEYQDINWIQNQIIEYLNEESHKLFVVGDKNQCIYGFRGSESSYIENFLNTHKDSNFYYITKNYRSQSEILSLAEESINNNTNQIPTKIVPVKEKVIKPQINKFEDSYKQSENIAQEIKKISKKGIGFENICILVRNNFLTRELEMSLKRSRIPYKVLSGISFFERKHIKDILSILKFMDNPYDEISFIRCISLTKGIGNAKIKLMLPIIREKGNIFKYSLEELNLNFKGQAKTSYEILRELFLKLLKMNSIFEQINVIYDTFYKDYMFKLENPQEREEDVQALLENSKIYNNLNEFLTEVALNDNNTDENNNKNYVTITTVHKSKGLEWDVVFLTHMNENCFPSKYAFTKKEIEEERNLFYVAITRARLYLYISYVLYGTLAKMNKSLFLEELERDLNYNYKDFSEEDRKKINLYEDIFS